MLDAAGVLCRTFPAHADARQPERQDAVPLVNFLCRGKAKLRQMEPAAVFNGQIAAFAQQADRAADRGLGIAHVFAHVHGADLPALVQQHVDGFQIHLT